MIIKSSSLITVSEENGVVQDSVQRMYFIIHHYHKKSVYPFLAFPFNIIFLKASRMILNQAS